MAESAFTTEPTTRRKVNRSNTVTYHSVLQWLSPRVKIPKAHPKSFPCSLFHLIRGQRLGYHITDCCEGFRTMISSPVKILSRRLISSRKLLSWQKACDRPTSPYCMDGFDISTIDITQSSVVGRTGNYYEKSL